MSKQIFAVPDNQIVEFVGILEENDLHNTNIGVDEDDNVLIEVVYSRDEREAILDLMELTEDAD